MNLKSDLDYDEVEQILVEWKGYGLPYFHLRLNQLEKQINRITLPSVGSSLSSPSEDDVDLWKSLDVDLWERVCRNVPMLAREKEKATEDLSRTLREFTITEFNDEIERIDSIVKRVEQSNAHSKFLLSLDVGLLTRRQKRKEAVEGFFNKYAEQIKELLGEYSSIHTAA